MGEGFKKSYGMTIGADFAVYKMDDYILHIWDLAGQIRFSQIVKAYYIGTVGSLLVFDVTKKDTFHNLPRWIGELIRNNNNTIIPMVVVGNKSDLRDKARDCIKLDEIQAYMNKLSEWTKFEVPYIETSALSGLNVETTFKNLAMRIDEHNS